MEMRSGNRNHLHTTGHNLVVRGWLGPDRFPTPAFFL